MIKILFKKLLNRKIIDLGWWLWYIPKDIINQILGSKDPYIPPIRKMFDGARNISSFKTDGDKLFKYYIELCDLKPDERILDIGCGIGRKTRPLISFLNDEGHYDGIDIVNKGIKWCKDAITRKNPNFQFHYVDVYNKHYNPKGNIKASEFVLPFGNESFDFVVLYSVFTHMLPEDVENYMGEVSRVLRKNGRCLISYFLLNSESKKNIAVENTNPHFKYRYGKHLTINPGMPEDAICFDETYVLELYDKHQLAIKNPISYGSWSARNEYVYYQDMIVAYR